MSPEEEFPANLKENILPPCEITSLKAESGSSPAEEKVDLTSHVLNVMPYISAGISTFLRPSWTFFLMLHTRGAHLPWAWQWILAFRRWFSPENKWYVAPSAYKKNWGKKKILSRARQGVFAPADRWGVYLCFSESRGAEFTSTKKNFARFPRDEEPGSYQRRGIQVLV